MKRSALAIAALSLLGPPSICPAQVLTKCVAGESVTDAEGKTGVIVSADRNLCQVKYADGQIYGWIFWNLRPAASPPVKSQLPKSGQIPAAKIRGSASVLNRAVSTGFFQTRPRFARQGYQLSFRNVKQGREVLAVRPEIETHARVPVAFWPSLYNDRCRVEQRWTDGLALNIAS